MRVPVPDGSVTDLVCVLEREASADEVNAAYERAAGGALNGILVFTEDAIVSSDIVGNPASCILDGLSTMSHGRDGQGDRLVRQRVGLQLPPRRRRREDRRLGGRSGSCAM